MPPENQTARFNSSEGVAAFEAQEARTASRSKIDAALQSSSDTQEFWNNSQNALVAELNTPLGWEALADYMRAEGGPMASGAVDAAKKMVRLMRSLDDPGADKEEITREIDDEMIVAEDHIRKTFDAIYRREKPEGRPHLEILQGGQEDDGEDFDKRVDAHFENQDFTPLVKEYSAEFKQYGAWLKENGSRVDPSEFAGVMDGVQRMIKGDLSRIMKPGKFDAITLEDLKSSLQEIKRSIGPLRQGANAESAMQAFEELDTFIKNLP